MGKPTGEIAALDTTNATCVGQFRFDSEYSGRGHSECTRGAGVDFTASSAETVAVDLVCNYTLVYDYGVEPQHGTGDIACDDGTVGPLAFGLTSPQGGEAVATLRDGRVLKFTYTYIYL